MCGYFFLCLCVCVQGSVSGFVRVKLYNLQSIQPYIIYHKQTNASWPQIHIHRNAYYRL